MWYSAIGCLVTVIAGLIISAFTGLENPADVNEKLLSPPVKELLSSLSTSMKEKLRVPLKNNVKRNITPPTGVINMTLDMTSEKCPFDKVESQGTFPKISSPS